MSQIQLNKRFKGYKEHCIDIQDKMSGLQKQSKNRKAQADSISAFMFELHETDESVTEFGSKLWTAVIDSVLVRKTGRLLFQFKNGMEVEGCRFG